MKTSYRKQRYGAPAGGSRRTTEGRPRRRRYLNWGEVPAGAPDVTWAEVLDRWEREDVARRQSVEAEARSTSVREGGLERKY